MSEDSIPHYSIEITFSGSLADQFVEDMKGLGLEDPGDYLQILIQLGKVARKALENGDSVYVPVKEENTTYTFKLAPEIMPPKMVDKFFNEKMNDSFAEDSLDGLRVVLPDVSPDSNPQATPS